HFTVRRTVALLGLPAVLVAAWSVARAGSTDFYRPPLARILAAFRYTWFARRLLDVVAPRLARLAVGYRGALCAGLALGVGRAAGAVDRHHPDGHQRDVRGEQRARVHRRAVPAQLRDSGDVERGTAARPARSPAVTGVPGGRGARARLVPRAARGRAGEPLMLDVAGLRKVYEGQGHRVEAIADLTFRVGTGEFACLVGPSG